MNSLYTARAEHRTGEAGGRGGDPGNQNFRVLGCSLLSASQIVFGAQSPFPTGVPLGSQGVAQRSERRLSIGGSTVGDQSSFQLENGIANQNRSLEKRKESHFNSYLSIMTLLVYPRQSFLVYWTSLGLRWQRICWQYRRPGSTLWVGKIS